MEQLKKITVLDSLISGSKFFWIFIVHLNPKTLDPHFIGFLFENML